MHRMQLQHRRRIAAAAILAAAAVPGGTSAAWAMPEVNVPSGAQIAAQRELARQDLRAPDTRDIVGARQAAALSLEREQRAAQAAAVDIRSLHGVPAAGAPADSAGFDWADAGIGAGLVVAMAGIGGVVLTGRRRGLAH
jgi:hypothetical protein